MNCQAKHSDSVDGSTLPECFALPGTQAEILAF